MSDDGAEAITLIAFIGSVFSPYYAWARRRGPADPENHCALNVALYRRGRGRWAMTERGSMSLQRTRDTLAIGRSALAWDGTALTFHIDETTMPIPTRLRGTVRVLPAALTGVTLPLDAAGRHRWSPIAPTARVEVAFTDPPMRWSGPGYLDSNDGDRPLERDFQRWDWACAQLPDGAATLFEVTPREAVGEAGTSPPIALRFDRNGAATPFTPPAAQPLPRTRWGMRRTMRSECDVAVTRSLEDAPFYARALIRPRLFGATVPAMHESLSLDRFRSPWVQAMLPFRMPRKK